MIKRLIFRDSHPIPRKPTTGYRLKMCYYWPSVRRRKYFLGPNFWRGHAVMQLIRIEKEARS